MSKKKDDEAWFAKHFPTVRAREVADKAVDKLDPHETMATYIDTWIAAYVAAGGKTKIALSS